MGRDRNQTDRPGDGSVVGAGARSTVLENGIAPYGFAAVAARCAVVRDAPAVLDVDGTARHVVAVD